MTADLVWWDIVLRLTAAAVLGALVGLEREYAGQDAGFRTHLLLALGSGLFGIVSVGAFDSFIDDGRSNVQVDVTRVASYVAAGVGFIGGGAILKHAGTVRGITTASSLWAAAAIGLSVGVGFWVGAITATVISLVALAALRPLSNWIDRRSHLPKTVIVLLRSPARSADALAIVQDLASPSIKSVRIGDSHGADLTEVVVQFWSRPEDEVVTRISARLDDELGDDLATVSLRS